MLVSQYGDLFVCKTNSDVSLVIDDGEIPALHRPIDPPFSHLKGCKELPDVIFVVEKTELPAHRFILSERSEYFQIMFSSSFIEANFTRIELKEINLKAFELVLEYIYTGAVDHLLDDSIPLDEVFDRLECARFYILDDLVVKLIEYIKKRGLSEPCLLLNMALFYSFNNLIPYAYDLVKKGFVIPKKEMFNQLSYLSLDYCLKRKTEAPESILFDALIDWMQNNPEHSFSYPKLLKHIDLHILAEDQLEQLFKPTVLIDRSVFQPILNLQQEQAKQVQKINNRNIFNDVKPLRIVHGTKYLQNNLGCTWIAPSENIIIVDLKQQFLLNCLKFQTNNPEFYTVSVSTNMRDWDLVIDHSKYECFGLQTLYFKERPVRFFKIRLNASRCLITKSIQALYSTDPVDFDPATTLSIPFQNVTEMSYKLNSKTGGGFTNGKIFAGRVRHLDANGIVYQFSQPYVIDSMKLLVGSESSYTVFVKATDEWTRVLAEDNVTGWRIVTFKKQPVMFIKIVGVFFTLLKLECPANSMLI